MATEGVAVLGLGKMGAALADALLATGHDLAVWNRTAAKAQRFSALGANLAPGPAEAVAGSQIIVLCLDDVATCREVLDEAELGGRVLVQVTSGSPEEVRAFASWANRRGAEVVEGMILVYPSAIGTEHSRILYAGDPTTMERARSVLDAFGGCTPVGPDIGSVSSLSIAARALYLISSTALVSSLEAARRLGAPLDETLEEMARLQTIALEGVRSSLAWIRGERPEGGAEGVTLRRLAESAAAVCEYLTPQGLDTRLLEAARHHLEHAVASGEAESPICAAARSIGQRG